jgi:hypothetical protein
VLVLIVVAILVVLVAVVVVEETLGVPVAVDVMLRVGVVLAVVLVAEVVQDVKIVAVTMRIVNTDHGILLFILPPLVLIENRELTGIVFLSYCYIINQNR